ncbi:conjugal transfer protein TraG N-terminal domain-containing protein [Aquisalimonas asiatica]|uniref:TraG-like protein, N-terminal region n=1 Tax=Aquisalimonas asiatica TaxID=406100 RepID=A0A1H8T2I8_9GAMM|nr:conjugal transfer protein TraG N-terminal domain-containing protein [Aquisalimonas asiatica]SEO85152.1 TraG-like protein, N-terminal region [Aquisalimonas asiatica]
MNVQHPLETFTTVFGWLQFETIWSILTGTGLAFIPFALIIIQAWSRAHQGTEAKAGSRKSVADAEVSIALALSVVVLAGQPAIQLGTTTLDYEDPCGQVPETSDTPYHDVFDDTLSQAHVPVWWYGTMALGSGITGAAISGIGCPDDVVQTRLDFDRQRIHDESVAHQVERFAAECFVPARSRYRRERPDVDTILETYGEDDPAYIGSRVFLSQGYYDRYRASRPVEGWPFEESRDGTADFDGTEPQYGRPYCSEWWQGGAGPSLRQMILEQQEPGLWDRVQHWVSTWGATEEEAEDQLIRTIVRNESHQPMYAHGDLAASDETAGQGMGQGTFSALTVSVGTAWHNYTQHGPMMYTIRSMAPIIQSFLLMGIYMLLPLMLVFSSYSWMGVFTATIAIISIKLWSYLWAVVIWLEDHMMRALTGPEISSLFGTAEDSVWDTHRQMVEMATGLLHIGLPLIFSMVVAWGGYNSLKQLGSQEGGSAPVSSAGQRGPSTTYSLGREGANISRRGL